MSKVLSRFLLCSFSYSFHPLLVAIKHSQDFLCLIVHLMNVNKSVKILIARPPMIPIAIEITNVCPKLKVVVYVMQRTTHTSKTSGKESKNFLSISSALLCFIYLFYCSFEIKLVQKFHLDPLFKSDPYLHILVHNYS